MGERNLCAALEHGASHPLATGKMGFIDTCCMYFCTAMGLFDSFTLFLMGFILQSGGGWYLSVPDDQQAASALACFIAGGIYLVYLVGCGLRIAGQSGKKGAQELEDDEAVV